MNTIELSVILFATVVIIALLVVGDTLPLEYIDLYEGEKEILISLWSEQRKRTKTRYGFYIKEMNPLFQRFDFGKKMLCNEVWHISTPKLNT